jgi:hypothetical protein
MKYFLSALALAGLVASPLVSLAQQSPAPASPVKHVLLLSVDGMHAVDFLNCSFGVAGVNGGQSYCPNMTALAHNGLSYAAASTSKPSDSFPGLTALVTGGSPRTTGVYYDVAYDRSLDAPAKTTGNGVAAGPCTPGAAPSGTTTEYEEGIDLDQSKLNGGAPGASLTDGGINSIDTNKLPRNPAASCAPVLPWNFVRTNSIFSVIHQAGGYTAWTDKHPSYSSVAGQGGSGAIDDYYSPEINSAVVGLPGVTTPEGLSCSTPPDGSQLGSWTDSFQNIQCYDTLKVNSILSEIAGKNHLGTASTKVPTLFGMNFQVVSVGQKLIESGTKGGYTDAQGTPSAQLLSEIKFVDDSVGEMVSALKSAGIYQDTVIIITAKHGQSPIDPNLYKAIPGKTNAGTTPATLLASLLPTSESPLNPTGIGATEDDISLLWLADGKNTASAVETLEGNAASIGLGQIFFGPSLWLNYNIPGLGGLLDPRTPDIIVTPKVGVTYTGSAKKQSEHGGFSHDDTNVMLLVANPNSQAAIVSTPVETAQVAPTILQLLGLDPQTLQAVQIEGTPVLPGVAEQLRRFE